MGEKSDSTERALYEIRNSIWKNLAVCILCLGFDLAGLLVLLGPSHSDWSSVWGILFFGFGVVVFGFKTLDRRIKIHADSEGIQDYRGGLGVIAWSELDSIRAMTVKGNTYLTLYFHNPAKWLRLSSRWTRWLVSVTKMRFGASMSLQNLDVDERQFTRFIDTKIRGSSKAS